MADKPRKWIDVVVSRDGAGLADALSRLGVDAGRNFPPVLLQLESGIIVTAAQLMAILDAAFDDPAAIAEERVSGSDGRLSDSDILEDTQVWSATSRLFMNHHWSNALIHGPDMMFSISPLIETMLAPGENVTTMNIRFQAAVTRELKMFASFSDPVAVPQEYIGRKPDVVADFETDKGRRIKFCAFQTDQVVNSNACGNLAAADIAREFETGYEVATVEGREVRIFDLARLSPKFYPNFNELNDSTPLGTELNTAMELVLLAMSAMRKSRRSIIPDAAWRLAASFKDFKPPALEDLSPPTKLEVFVDLANIKGNGDGDGFRFLPIKFAFKRRDKVVGSGTYIDAYPSSDRFADAWCAEHLG